MTDDGPRPGRGEDNLPRTRLCELGVLRARIEIQLSRKQELGLLSITVLRRENASESGAWSEYDAVVREISSFLRSFSGQEMRKNDVLLDPAVSGNTFVVVLGPPRHSPCLSFIDTQHVQRRLMRGLTTHLAATLHRSISEPFGLYIGTALMRHEPRVDCERIIHRCLEESVANAMKQRRAEAEHQAACLAEVLETEGVTAVYQPLVDLSRQSVIGYEALTRITDASFATPDLLFRAAQQNGALWRLERICRRIALSGLPPMDRDQLLFLNIEPESFRDPELLGSAFLEQLAMAGLEPDKIVLEVTEHASVTDFTLLRDLLRRCRDHGFRLALDDVGAGFSGLRAIAEIEPDYLKVDMTLVRDLHLRRVKRELISSIMSFAENTGTTLIAEGVESLEELESLFDLGVRCAQGYLFSRPAAPPDPPDWRRLSPAIRPSVSALV